MNIWSLAVDNKVAVYILMVMIVLFGWSSYMRLPREASPDITIPYVIVATPYIGVAPSDIEGLVTQPLERALKGLKDIKQISSVSKEGLSTIQVEFNTGIDVDEALRRVRDRGRGGQRRPGTSQAVAGQAVELDDQIGRHTFA